MSAEFRSPKEFREVMDRVFGMMDADPDMGPKLATPTCRSASSSPTSTWS